MVNISLTHVAPSCGLPKLSRRRPIGGALAGRAACLGGFALVRVTERVMDVVLGEASGPHGQVVFTDAFSKPLG
jgi:cytolysin (calcineurin-like family phosphatase)